MTAIIGKWHLGHADRKYWPRQRGFDYQYGAMIGEVDYFTHDEHGVLDWFRDDEPVREEGYTTTLLGNDAVRLIESHDPATPLYLYLPVPGYVAASFRACSFAVPGGYDAGGVRQTSLPRHKQNWR